MESIFKRLDRGPKMVKELLKHGVEPNATEEPVSFSSSQWPIMLGAYIGQAHSDNLTRSKATIDGIFGTLKSGRCSNKAPRGYVNKHLNDDKGMVIKKYVDIDEAKARPIKKAFEELAEGNVSAEYVRLKYCSDIPKNTFLCMLRNPFYMGKIRVPRRKDIATGAITAEHLVDGKHTALITQEVFKKVQDVLNGKKSKKPKLDKTAKSEFFLRKFLVCPICGHALTGAFSKGRSKRYPYYNCCGNAKHIRKRAETVNEGFVQYISDLVPNDTVSKLYNDILLDLRGEGERELSKEIDDIKKQLSAKKNDINKVEDMMLTDIKHRERYMKMIDRYEEEAKELENKAETLEKSKDKGFKQKINYSMSLLANIPKFITDAPVELKVKLIGSIFPEKIEFDGKEYRTTSFNKVLDLIFQETMQLQGYELKKRRNLTISPTLYPDP